MKPRAWIVWAAFCSVLGGGAAARADNESIVPLFALPPSMQHATPAPTQPPTPPPPAPVVPPAAVASPPAQQPAAPARAVKPSRPAIPVQRAVAPQNVAAPPAAAAGQPSAAPLVSQPSAAPRVVQPIPAASPKVAPKAAHDEVNVRPDETLMELALRLYGQIDYWRAIQAINPDVPTDQVIGPGVKLKLFKIKPVAPAEAPQPCFRETYEFCANAPAGSPLTDCLRARSAMLSSVCLDWALPCRKFEKSFCASAQSGVDLEICMRKHALDLSQECVDVIEREGKK